MPRKPRKLKQELIEQEGRVECVIRDLNSRNLSNIEQAIRAYNLPPQTLRDRLKGHPSQTELRNHNHRLSECQEEALIAWIVSLDIHGAPPRHFQVQEMAQIILDAGSSTPSRPIRKN
jgi:hypothetical protein